MLVLNKDHLHHLNGHGNHNRDHVHYIFYRTNCPPLFYYFKILVSYSLKIDITSISIKAVKNVHLNEFIHTFCFQTEYLVIILSSPSHTSSGSDVPLKFGHSTVMRSKLVKLNAKLLSSKTLIVSPTCLLPK